MTNKVQIPGDCYGTVLAVETKIDGSRQTEIAHIKLDKSGVIVRINLADCKVLS